MSRLHHLALLLLFAFGSAACGGDGASSQPSPEADHAERPTPDADEARDQSGDVADSVDDDGDIEGGDGGLIADLDPRDVMADPPGEELAQDALVEGADDVSVVADGPIDAAERDAVNDPEATDSADTADESEMTFDIGDSSVEDSAGADPSADADPPADVSADTDLLDDVPADATEEDGDMAEPVRDPPTPWAPALGSAPASITVLDSQPCDAPTDSLVLTESAVDRGFDFYADWPGEAVADQRDRHVGGGLAVIDLTGDDHPDLVATSVWGHNALFVNDGTAHFELVAGPPFEDLPHALSATAIDLDDDGLRELILTSWTGLYAYPNLGDGQFDEPVTLWSAPADDRPIFTSWTDYDGDGLVDVYVGVGPDCFRTPSFAPCEGEDQLLRGMGGFEFENVTSGLGTYDDRTGFALAGSWLDVDRDGDLDMLVGNDSGHYAVPNRVFENPGLGAAGEPLSEASSDFFLNARMAAMGTAFGQLDGKSGTEIMVSNIGKVYMFSLGTSGRATNAYRDWQPVIRHDRFFYDNAALSVASWAVELEDLDHDTDLDLITAWGWLLPVNWWEGSRVREDITELADPLQNTVWLWDGRKFVDHSDTLDDAPDSWGYRSVAPVDLDRNGSLDLVFASVAGPVSLQMSQCSARSWLWVSLRGGPGNPDALGSRVVVTGDFGEQWRRIGLGSTGAYTGREPVAHFGLGEATEVSLRVVWPDGFESDLGVVAANQRLHVTRDDASSE